MSVYARSAAYYDALYRSTGKDYASESAAIAALIATHCRSGGNALLDVACGTGGHLQFLRASFDCEGLDVDRAMLGIARDRLADVPMHLQDMISFHLDRRFDAIVCLFSAIGYVPNAGRLDQTIATFFKHLKPGGVAIVEPWIRPSDWIDGLIHADFADEPDLKVARMSISRRDGNASILNFHYMIAGSDGVRTFVEPHRLMLFTDEEYRRAFERAGFALYVEPHGLTGRGLLIGTKPL